MLFLWLLSVMLSIICTGFGEWDNDCEDNCSCCKQQKCGLKFGWNNSCTLGCIDGHRGARCYERCHYKNCKSCGGIGNTKECTECYDGYNLRENKDCCPANCGCNDQGDCFSCKEKFYDTSTSCKKRCPPNCLMCVSGESCSKCIDGFYNGRENDMSKKQRLNNCTYACRDTCTQCLSYNNCSQCAEGKYGKTCQKDCSLGCKDQTCSIDSGQCHCKSNFSGDKCIDCVHGRYGFFCNETCSKYCKEQTCEKTSGMCNGGCTSQNITGASCDTCIKGMYGELCNITCPIHCKNSKCHRYNGDCSEGCKENFNGTMCDRCMSGKYGKKCDVECPANCAGNICERIHGTCNGCNGNFQGQKCVECMSGYYGRNCNEACSQYCANYTCHKNTGKCSNGCIDGYSGDRCCVMSKKCFECYNNTECKTCVPGFFQTYCNETCRGGCNGPCHISSGECILSKGQSGKTANLTGTLSGGVAALVAVVAGISLTYFLFRRRRTQKDSGDESIVNSALSSDRSGERMEKLNVKEGPVYANIKDKRAREADLEDVVIDETNDNALDDETGYYNCDSVNMNVKVADLFSYVTKGHFDIFDKEFKNLPKPCDLSVLCKVAKRPENIALNRYNGIYPFDHSRVTIPGQAKFFINACYIDGYHRSKAYIASLGPTFKHTENFTTFWRMVWHEKSDIIVMLTNLREASGMKCDQYWPEMESEECYGKIKVKCRSIEEFAEYTVRCFTVSKGKEHRHLTQLHFTAWPDKGVPSEVTSLVEFRQRVKAAPVVLDGPVIVHCSAGVGRTGTYIALDILSEQGKAEGSVNIFNCVSEMRGQRVNMVQTAEQYIFLYKALVHTLTFGCESQTAEEIQSLAFDSNSRFLNIFQTLKQEVDHEGEQNIAEREENRRNHPDKSRRNSDIPGHRGRVRLYLHRKSGNHDFINAVFIDSFKLKDLFIAAQTPQTDTVEDFLCMMYQQNSSCVVALEDQQQLSRKHVFDIGVYLPADNETYQCGAFTVTRLNCETKSQYTVKKLTIKHTDKGEEKVAYHFQYTKWGNGRKIADNPGEFVQFVKDVEKNAKQREADMPNLVVHCLNGYERSGLFCVVYTLLEKLEAERQVSVVNVIRKIRAQRKLSITSVEQLKFCYQCISAYLEAYNTYTNY